MEASERKRFLLEWRRSSLHDLGKNAWLTVHERPEKDPLDPSYASIHCALIPNSDVEHFMDPEVRGEVLFDCRPGMNQSNVDGVETTTYHRLGWDHDGLEPLVLHRTYGGLKPEHYELTEEFRLYHNLYYDDKRKSFVKVFPNGTEEEVVRMGAHKIEIRLTELRQFLAAKGMHLMLMFDYRTFTRVALDEFGKEELYVNETFPDELLFYELKCGPMHMDSLNFARVYGRKLIQPFPIERCGIWPYDDEDHPKVNFIIGTDADGRAVEHPADEDELDSPFDTGGVPFLTPVYFRKDVLQKYLTDPDRYQVSDGHLSCGHLWGMPIDNDIADHVAVFLGDLEKLPYEDQLYWRGHNIKPEGRKMSLTNFKRSIEGQFASATQPDHSFRQEYWNLQSCFVSVDWPLLLKLAEGDKHLLETLRVPLNASQAEFDSQVGALAKIIIDSLNVKGIKAALSNVPKDVGSIGLLELLCKEKGINGYEGPVKFLRNLQGLRSAGVGHRKGAGYEKAAAQFGIPDVSLPDAFREILVMARDTMVWMRDAVIPIL